MKLQLISNWKQSWRFYSVQLGLLIAAIGFFQAEVLPHLREQLEPSTYGWISFGLGVLLTIARLIYQPSLGATPPQEPDQ